MRKTVQSRGLRLERGWSKRNWVLDKHNTVAPPHTKYWMCTAHLMGMVGGCCVLSLEKGGWIYPVEGGRQKQKLPYGFKLTNTLGCWWHISGFHLSIVRLTRGNPSNNIHTSTELVLLKTLTFSLLVSDNTAAYYTILYTECNL